MSLARESELELKLELTRDELQRVRSHPALGDLAVGEPVTRTAALDLLRHARPPPEGARHLACGCDRTARAGGRPSRPAPASSNGVSSPVEVGDRRRAARARPRPHRQPQDPPQGREGRGAVDPGAGVRDRGAAHDAPAALGRRRAGACPRRGHGARRRRRERPVRGRAGAEIGRARVPARRRRPSCSAAQPVRLAESSKAERGYSLALGRTQRARARRAAARRAARSFDAEQTCAEAFGLIVRSAADQIVANRRAVLETEDPAAAHQLRIGLRRLRSALRAFRPLHDTPALRELEGHAQALARTVGELRDADVLIEEIYAPVAGAHQGRSRRAARARGAARPSRPHARARARGARRASNGRCCSSISRCGRARSRMRRRTRPARSRSSPAPPLKRQWKKVADSGERLDELTVEQRHEMRKALKTLRYTAEFFASLYPEPRTRPLRQGDPQPAGGVRLSQRRGGRRAARRHLPRRLRRQPRGPARGGLRARLAQRAGRPRLEGRPQGLAAPEGAAALLGVTLGGIVKPPRSSTPRYCRGRHRRGRPWSRA